MLNFLALESNLIGIVGVIFVLVAYSLLQIGKMSSNQLSYSLLNVIGSVLILISLYYHWNLASVVIEIAWMVISLYGLIRALRISYLARQG